MRHPRRLWLLILVMASALAACRGGDTIPATAPPSEEQVVEIAWEALAPNTSSHRFANWLVGEVRLVTGSEVGTSFEGRPAPGCSGPTPPANEKVDPSASYWLVRMRPRPATPKPEKTPLGPTAPPLVPEPNLDSATLLIDAESGRVVARRLYCLVY